MTSSQEFRHEAVWAGIERDKRYDRRLRRISTAAWGVTLVIVLAWGVLTALQVVNLIRLIGVGLATRLAVVAAVTPFLIALGALSLLVAVLSTVGVFLRLRTASLAEIQLRLSAVEAMLAGRGEGAGA